jgi:hypothetical protein
MIYLYGCEPYNGEGHRYTIFGAVLVLPAST